MGELKKIRESAEKEIKATENLDRLEELRIQFLGRQSGALTIILRGLKDLPENERKKMGDAANRLRQDIEGLLDKKLSELKRLTSESVLEKEWIDVTRPGIRRPKGHVHPLTKLMREMEDIFTSMGFEIAEGPEVEHEYYNFDTLNIPAKHPARDMWDTFWIKPRSEKLALRPHTSPVQIRYMQGKNPPFRVIAPGRVYRYEATDASHEIQFYQLEGFMVGPDISIANFKSVIQEFFSRLFGGKTEIMLRPSYFPFTEPSFEVDMRKIGDTKWLEIAGAGMIHPNVLRAAGQNPNQCQGFAFGMGIDRIAMLKYKIPDVRLFHSGDLKFLKQF